jgi:hypothetical protein
VQHIEQRLHTSEAPGTRQITPVTEKVGCKKKQINRTGELRLSLKKNHSSSLSNHEVVMKPCVSGDCSFSIEVGNPDFK